MTAIKIKAFKGALYFCVLKNSPWSEAKLSVNT